MKALLAYCKKAKKPLAVAIVSLIAVIAFWSVPIEYLFTGKISAIFNDSETVGDKAMLYAGLFFIGGVPFIWLLVFVIKESWIGFKESQEQE